MAPISDPPRQDDPLALDRQVCFALAVASRSVIAFYRPILEPLGLTHPQYLVMLALWQHAPLRFGEVAQQLRLDPATLTPIVKRLEAQELVERQRVDGDDRTFTLSPTEKGAALRDRAVAVPRMVVERLGMPIERLTALRDELTGLIAAVDRAAPSARAEENRSSQR